MGCGGASGHQLLDEEREKNKGETSEQLEKFSKRVEGGSSQAWNLESEGSISALFKKKPGQHHRGSFFERSLGKGKRDCVEAFHEDGSNGAANGDTPANNKKVHHNQKACQHHKKRCSDIDFATASTIEQAYPFANNQKKAVTKKERVHGADKVDKWGTVDVSVLSAKKLDCAVCGVFIVDRDGQNLFYYCRRCPTLGKSLNLCLACYNAGILSTGSKARERVVEREANSSMVAARSTDNDQIRPPAAGRRKPPSDQDGGLQPLPMDFLPGSILSEGWRPKVPSSSPPSMCTATKNPRPGSAPRSPRPESANEKRLIKKGPRVKT